MRLMRLFQNDSKHNEIKIKTPECHKYILALIHKNKS